MVAIKKEEEGIDLMEMEEDYGLREVNESNPIGMKSLEVNRKEVFNFQELSEEEINESLKRPGSMLEAVAFIFGMKFLMFLPMLLTLLYKDFVS